MKQFIRNFKKQKTVGLLNICSLSLGVMVAIVVGLLVINELSFDSFHKNKESIHRIIIHATLNDSPTKIGSMFKPMGEEASVQSPQIKDMTRVYETYQDLKIKTDLYLSTQALIVDNNFFSFFSFERGRSGNCTFRAG